MSFWDTLGSIGSAVIGPAASVVGDLIGAHSQDQATNAASADVAATNQANAAQAQANRDFQERMSSTAFQRSAADMRAAGYNPAVMMQGAGSSASTPSGSVIPMQNAADAIMAGAREKSRIYSGMPADALAAANAVTQNTVMKSQEKLNQAMGMSAASQATLNQRMADLTDVKKQTEMASAYQEQYRAARLKAMIDDNKAMSPEDRLKVPASERVLADTDFLRTVITGHIPH